MEYKKTCLKCTLMVELNIFSYNNHEISINLLAEGLTVHIGAGTAGAIPTVVCCTSARWDVLAAVTRETSEALTLELVDAGLWARASIETWITVTFIHVRLRNKGNDCVEKLKTNSKSLRESIPRLLNWESTAMTARCAPACSQVLPVKPQGVWARGIEAWARSRDRRNWGCGGGGLQGPPA